MTNKQRAELIVSRSLSIPTAPEFQVFFADKPEDLEKPKSGLAFGALIQPRFGVAYKDVTATLHEQIRDRIAADNYYGGTAIVSVSQYAKVLQCDREQRFQMTDRGINPLAPRDAFDLYISTALCVDGYHFGAYQTIARILLRMSRVEALQSSDRLAVVTTNAARLSSMFSLGRAGTALPDGMNYGYDYEDGPFINKCSITTNSDWVPYPADRDNPIHVDLEGAYVGRRVTMTAVEAETLYTLYPTLFQTAPKVIS